jgi:hypothetical protein
MGANMIGSTSRNPENHQSGGLLAGERILMQSSDRAVSLTNHRVVYQAAAAGSSNFRSITLDAVSSCGLTTTSQPLLLIFGAIAVICGVIVIGDKMMRDQSVGVFALFVGVILVVLYFATRKAALVICSNGGERISLAAPASHRDSLLALLHAVDEAKLAALHHAAPLTTTVDVAAARPSRPPPLPPSAGW